MMNMMNTNNPFLMDAVNFDFDSKEYTAICDKREKMKCHTYQITDQIILEFWGKNEWEFTLAVPSNDPNAAKYQASTIAMGAYLKRNNPTLTRLPHLVSYCKLIAKRGC